MQRNRADVKSSDKNRLVFLVGRLHSAALVPRRQKRPAAHRADDFSVLFVHLRDISVTRERQPVGVHRLLRASNSRLENVLQLAALAVQLFIVQEHYFREKHGLFAGFLALSVLSHFEH